MTKQKVYEEVKKRIAEEDLAPGQWIIERELCEAYGISRTPVREILLKLSNEGLLESEAGKGYKVKKLESEEIVAIFKARAAIEGYAARLASRSGNQGLMDSLRVIHEKLAKLNFDENTQEILSLGRQVHNLVIESCDNFLLKEFYEKLQNYTILTTNYSNRWINIESQSKEGHIKLIEAILSGDADAAERAMWDHLQTTIRLLLNSYISSYAELL